MITLTQFWHDVALMAQGHVGQRQRYGQIAFNMLAHIRPDLSERVRGSDMDPFYATHTDDDKLRRFREFLETNWER